MALLIERTLRQFWMPGITKVEGKRERGLQGFLLDDRYRIYSQPSATKFEITPFDADEIKQAICHDLSRMACAAFESFHTLSAPPDLTKSSGWGAIRAYYASFFAAHSIVRIFGRTCTQLDTPHIQYISKVESYNNSQIVFHSNGIYYSVWDEGNSILRFEKPSGSAAGGAHEITWRLFLDTLNYLRDSLLAPKAVGLVSDLQQAALDLDSIRAALCEGGFNNGSWLSHVRNRVNYRHDFDAWFPYGQRASHYQAIWNAGTGRWLRPPLPIKKIPIMGRELERLMELSGAIVSLCRCLIEHIDAVAATKKSFIRYGPKSLIELAKK